MAVYRDIEIVFINGNCGFTLFVCFVIDVEVDL